MKRYVAMLALMVCCVIELSGKRPPPKPVQPVTKEGVRYSASGEFVVAAEEASGKELWRSKIYSVPPKVEALFREGGPYITTLKLSGGTLYVKDEAGRCYQVELARKNVSSVRCPVMKAAKSTSDPVKK